MFEWIVNTLLTDVDGSTWTVQHKQCTYLDLR